MATTSLIPTAASIVTSLVSGALNALKKPVNVGVSVKDGVVGVGVTSPLADVGVTATKDSAQVIVENILNQPDLGGVKLVAQPDLFGLDVKWLTGGLEVAVVGKDVSVSVTDNLVSKLIEGLATPLAPVLSAAESTLSVLGSISSGLPTLTAPSVQ